MLIALILLVIMTLIVGIFAIARIANLVSRSKRSRRGPKPSQDLLTYCLCITAVILLVLTIFCFGRYRQMTPPVTGPSGSTGTSDTTTGTAESTVPSTLPSTGPTDPPGPPADPVLNVGKTENSDPANWNVKWEIIEGNTIVPSYERDELISFANPNKYDYFPFPGVASFRGNNYRNGATYGTAVVENEKLESIWERKISSLPRASGAWTGVGWTGQPLIVQWDDETKAIMNMYENKKSKEGLVEVIYATLDGHIYFYDLEDGTYTRDPINVGMAFKGSGSLDPRGYPILYVGSGDKTKGGKVPRMFIISLIDGKIMYERGNAEPLAKRNWTAYDSAPLVDQETDTLIWPGENGLIFTMKLNTQYDKSAGTLTVAPDDFVINRYSTNINNATLGFESSAIIVDRYMYVGDNSGMLFCIDINTMQVQWAQYLKDDINATPVFEWGEDGNGYLYIAPSMEFNEGNVSIYKINAANGEIVWETTYSGIHYDKNVSGGALSSPLLGKPGTEMEGMIIFHIAKTPGAYQGITVALDTTTGEAIWEKTSSYCWSSPVAIYEEDGNAYIVLCDSAGNVHLLDAATGETLQKLGVGANVEASPAVFGNTLVVGTRGQKVFGIKIS